MKKTLISLFVCLFFPFISLTGNSCDACFCGTVEIDWLLWKVYPDGVFAAVKGFSDSTNFDAKTSSKHFDHDLDSGFRLGFSFASPLFAKWDFGLAWTHYSTNASKKLYNDDGRGTPALSPFFGVDLITQENPFSFIFRTSQENQSVKAHYDLKLNLIDFVSTYPICFSSGFILEPQLGLRLACGEEKLHSKTDGVIEPDISYVWNNSFHQDFSGVGPRIGLDLSWELGCGVCLYGNYATTFLCGDVDGEYKLFFTTTGTTPATSTDKEHDRHSICREIKDLELGICWEACLYSCLDVTLRCGWEFHKFDGQSPVNGIAGGLAVANQENSTLTIQGLRLGAYLGF